MVQQKLMKILSNFQLVSDFDKFRLFMTDAASYNILATKNLKSFFPKMIHVTCYTHFLSRVCNEIAEKNEAANEVVQFVKKVFEKCARRREEWLEFKVGNTPFPSPVKTRFGTWLKYVVFVSRNWITLKSYLETIKDSKAAKNALRFMKSQNTLNEVAEVASLEFLVNLISVSEARDFTIVKAVKQIETIVEKLVDLKETGNKTADAALTKFTKILDTNRGITDVKLKATGENIEEPSEMAIYAFAPASSIDVERFFSVLKAFLEDRPCILEKTVDKLMFVRYNQHI